MSLDKDLKKLVSRSRDGQGRINASKLSEGFLGLLESGEYPREEIISVLVSRQDVLIEEDKNLSAVLKKEGEMRSRLLAGIQSLASTQTKRIEELNTLIGRLLVLCKSHVAEVEAAARSVDTEKLGRDLYREFYKVSMLRLEEAPRGVEMATNRLLKEFEQSASHLKSKSSLQRLGFGLISVVCLSIGMAVLSYSYFNPVAEGSHTASLDSQLVEELKIRKARLVERGGRKLIVVEGAEDVVVNDAGYGVIVLPVEVPYDR